MQVAQQKLYDSSDSDDDAAAEAFQQTFYSGGATTSNPSKMDIFFNDADFGENPRSSHMKNLNSFDDDVFSVSTDASHLSSTLTKSIPRTSRKSSDSSNFKVFIDGAAVELEPKVVKISDNIAWLDQDRCSSDDETAPPSVCANSYDKYTSSSKNNYSLSEAVLLGEAESMETDIMDHIESPATGPKTPFPLTLLYPFFSKTHRTSRKVLAKIQTLSPGMGARSTQLFKGLISILRRSFGHILDIGTIINSSSPNCDIDYGREGYNICSTSDEFLTGVENSSLDQVEKGLSQSSTSKRTFTGTARFCKAQFANFYYSPACVVIYAGILIINCGLLINGVILRNPCTFWTAFFEGFVTSFLAMEVLARWALQGQKFLRLKSNVADLLILVFCVGLCVFSHDLWSFKNSAHSAEGGEDVLEQLLLATRFILQLLRMYPFAKRYKAQNTKRQRIDFALLNDNSI